MSRTRFNQSRECNIFIVGTPYQLITALNIIFSFYSTEKFENHVIILISDEIRFNPNLSEKKGNTNFKKVKMEDSLNQIRTLKGWRPDNFYFFQESSILNKFLSYNFKKHGAKICLGPDGTKAYGLFEKKHEFLSMIKDTLKDYKFLFQNKILLPKLFLSRNYRYGSFGLIDEIWLPYKELFNAEHNRSKGILKELPILTVDNLLEMSKILKIKLFSEFNGEGCILYFNQPFWSLPLINKDIEILTELTKRTVGKNFFIKIHPSTSNELIERYLRIPGVRIIEDNVPAEFYIAACRESILISGWSTCLMHPISNLNKSFFLYPIFKKLGDPILDQIEFIPFPHIYLVNSLDEIILN